mgnify:CR=1 FL=1
MIPARVLLELLSTWWAHTPVVRIITLVTLARSEAGQDSLTKTLGRDWRCSLFSILEDGSCGNDA